MDIKDYIAAANQQFQTGVAREHAYRSVQKWLEDRKGRSINYSTFFIMGGFCMLLSRQTVL